MQSTQAANSRAITHEKMFFIASLAAVSAMT
jgi:hypothetical protein